MLNSHNKERNLEWDPITSDGVWLLPEDRMYTWNCGTHPRHLQIGHPFLSIPEPLAYQAVIPSMKSTDYKTTYILSKTDTAWGIKNLHNTKQNENYMYYVYFSVPQRTNTQYFEYAILKQKEESYIGQMILFDYFKAKILFTLILCTAFQSHLRSPLPCELHDPVGIKVTPFHSFRDRYGPRPLQLIGDLSGGSFLNSHLI